MKLKVFLKALINLLWVFYVSSQQLPTEDIDDFVPITQEPLVYFPQPRIVGGQNAEDNQFPHQISLRVNNYHICGGSIISKNYVVTAGHCTRFPVSTMTIRAGSRLVNSGGIIIGVSEIKVHPDYRNFDNDIAVLKLSTSLPLSKSIQPIALATENPAPGSSVVTSGWGRLRNGGSSPVNLQYTTLKAISRNECKSRSGNVPASVICLAHTNGNGVCNGDSGGPAVYNNQLVGVTNYVVGGCASNYPDGYASVALFFNWIRTNSDL